MIINFVFVLFLIALSLLLEIRTHQKKRVIIASSGIYILVLYFLLFETFKDQSVLLLVVKFRPDLIIESFAPTILKLFTSNPFQESPALIKLLNVFGIKEGTRLFTFITNYRPIASDSPFTGISFNSVFSYINNVIDDFFGWTSYGDYCAKLKKIAFIFVLIIYDDAKKISFTLQKGYIRFKEDLFIA